MPPSIALSTNPVFTSKSAGNLLVEGDCIRMFDGSFHFVQYVNSSGAYAVSLATVKREIAGSTIAFTAGGRTISSHSIVEKVNPLLMGGYSPEYQRYVKMAKALGRTKGTVVRMGDEGNGATFDTFDNSEIDLSAAEAAEAEGQSANGDSVTPNNKAGNSMAKKAKAKTSGAKRDKTPKTVRKCACGCGGETTGYFVPGHDARMHGWQKRLQDGRIDISGKDAKTGEQVIPKAVIKSLDVTGTKNGAKVGSPHFYKD